MKRSIKYFIFFSLALLFFSFSKIEAKEVIASQNSVNISNDVVGSINLYDDYTVSFTYLYRVNNITIKVCKKIDCNDIDPQINSQNTYIDGEVAEFYIGNLLVKENSKVTYVIEAIGHFKPSNTATFSSETTLKYELVLPAITDNDTNDEYPQKATESLSKVKDFFNRWIIPGIYIVLVVTIIVKLILLCIDLVKFSDNHDLRREKIKGFMYVFIGVVVVALVNTGAGFITGLFDEFIN